MGQSTESVNFVWQKESRLATFLGNLLESPLHLEENNIMNTYKYVLYKKTFACQFSHHLYAQYH